MIITDDFVLLNFPKTGTTFTRKIIKMLYKDKFEELLLPYPPDTRLMHQHAPYARIPAEHRRKTILSIMRNPFDRYVSLFIYKWWINYPPERKEKLIEIYPAFPDIGFVEFLDMYNRFERKNVLTRHNASSVFDTDIGFQTFNFVAFHSKNPRSALDQLAQGKPDPFLELPKIHFLRQECLRKDLVGFLVKLLGDQSIEKIISAEKDENVSRLAQEKDWRQFWTSDLLKLYSEKERLLLNAFPEYKQDAALFPSKHTILSKAI